MQPRNREWTHEFVLPTSAHRVGLFRESASILGPSFRRRIISVHINIYSTEERYE